VVCPFSSQILPSASLRLCGGLTLRLIRLDQAGLDEAFLGLRAGLAGRGDEPCPLGGGVGEGVVFEEGLPVVFGATAFRDIGDEDGAGRFLEEGQVSGEEGGGVPIGKQRELGKQAAGNGPSRTRDQILDLSIGAGEIGRDQAKAASGKTRLDLNFDWVNGIDKRDFFETPLEKFEAEIIQVSTAENREGFISGRGAERFGDELATGVQMPFPSGPASARAMANANLSGEKAVRSCRPRTRCRDPFQ
jgi:hypothetical protein